MENQQETSISADTPSLGLRSSEIQELMGEIPGRILRWGATFTVIVVALAAALGHFIEWPETIEVPIVLKPSPGSVIHNVPTSARVQQVHVQPEEVVEAGTPLVTVEYTNGTRDTLRALAAGTVSLSAAVSAGAVLTSGASFAELMPVKQEVLGEITLSRQESERMKAGNKVLVNLPGRQAPLQGTLKGSVPGKPMTFAVKFGEGVPFSPSDWKAGERMETNADVVVGKRSLLDRLFLRP